MLLIEERSGCWLAVLRVRLKDFVLLRMIKTILLMEVKRRELLQGRPWLSGQDTGAVSRGTRVRIPLLHTGIFQGLSSGLKPSINR